MSGFFSVIKNISIFISFPLPPPKGGGNEIEGFPLSLYITVELLIFNATAAFLADENIEVSPDSRSKTSTETAAG